MSLPAYFSVYQYELAVRCRDQEAILVSPPKTDQQFDSRPFPKFDRDEKFYALKQELKISQVVPPRGVDAIEIDFKFPGLEKHRPSDLCYWFLGRASIMYDQDKSLEIPTFELEF
ncbi:MAG: hypothetical protein ACLQPD_00575 [Desulfomonilaceae bacterium]